MWIPLLIGLLAEFFNKSEKAEQFLVKVIGGGFVGLIINIMLALFLPSSVTSVLLVGLMPAITMPTINFAAILTITFLIIPFIATFIGLIIVYAARYLGVMKFGK